jgi:signal transduction histidine kinase/ActR/RegA family two-component response regulator
MWLSIAWGGSRVRGLSLWGWANLLFSAGGLFGGLRESVPAWLAVDIGNALILFATGLCWSAARRFDDRPAHLARALLGGVIWLLLRRIPGVTELVEVRIIIASLLAGAYIVGTAWVLSRKRGEQHVFRVLVVVAFGAHGVLILARIPFALMQTTWHETVMLPQNHWYGVVLMEAMLHAVATSFALLAMVREREQQRAVAEIAFARDAADRASAAKSRFLARMSHELRTPLNGVLGLAQVLAADRSLPAAARGHGTMIERAGRHLLALVNDVLDLAQVEAGRVTFDSQPVPLGRLLDSAMVLVQPEAGRKQIRLTAALMPGCPQVVMGDQLRLRQVLLNLLGNAVKFTPEHGEVRLELHALAEGGIRIEATDTGPGIPPEQRSLLFHDFSQMPGLHNQGREGNGLGLAISAGLVEAMGGQIGMAPGPEGKGSRFWANLPLPAGSAVPAPVAVRPAAGSFRILVVDDVALNRLVVQALLEAADHEVVLAESGHAAIAALTEGSFDLVLMDVQMPEMDGLETTRHIRAAESRRSGPGRIPILALTGEEMDGAVQACLEAGMDGHLPKPVDRTRLLAAVRHAIRGEVVPLSGVA